MATKMTTEAMKSFIDENINLVSDKTREAFDKLTVEEQYKKIQKLVSNKKFYDKKRSGVSACSKTVNKVQQIIRNASCTAADMDEIIAFCEEHKSVIKEREIEKISAEIERLTKMKEELSK